MSKYLNINELNIDDQNLLVSTLCGRIAAPGRGPEEFGFTVETYEMPRNLIGYRGEFRPETAEVIIRRKFAGDGANDIGFKRQESGNFQPIISAFDSRVYNSKWLGSLSQKYMENKQIQVMGREGFIVESSETLSSGETLLTFAHAGVI